MCTEPAVRAREQSLPGLQSCKLRYDLLTCGREEAEEEGTR